MGSTITQKCRDVKNERTTRYKVTSRPLIENSEVSALRGRAAALARRSHDGIGELVEVFPVGCSRKRISMQHLAALASESCSSATDVRRKKRL